MTFLAALAACGRPDPELTALARSLRLWEEGRAALEAGQPDAARDRFREAREARSSVLLGAWEASALARGGDLSGAIALLDEVLAASPSFAEARYNRAAYRVRAIGLRGADPADPAVSGELAAAAADLEQALGDGEIRGLSVLQDPDFASILDHPAFGFLPSSALALSVDAPPETAFWGAEVALRIHLLGIVDPPLSVAAEVASGPLELVSVVEDTVPTSLGSDGVEIVWTWRVIGAGPVVLGPLTVRAGRYAAEAGAVHVMASAPPDRVVPPSSLSLTLPSELLAALPPRSIAVIDGAPTVRARGTDRVEADPPSDPPIRYERRERGVPVEIAYRWPSVIPASVRIRDGSGAEVFAGPVPPR